MLIMKKCIKLREENIKNWVVDINKICLFRGFFKGKVKIYG